MTYDENYYKAKKVKLEQKKIQKMGSLIQNMTNFMNAFYADIKDIDEATQEIVAKEQASVKKEGQPNIEEK